MHVSSRCMQVRRCMHVRTPFACTHTACILQQIDLRGRAQIDKSALILHPADHIKQDDSSDACTSSSDKDNDSDEPEENGKSYLVP